MTGPRLDRRRMLATRPLFWEDERGEPGQFHRLEIWRTLAPLVS